MYGTFLPKKPRCVLILGSGALQIGQAGEFDYSGSQAIKALREEGIRTVLVNPNIATIQTSRELVDRLYLHAVTPETVGQILEHEEDIDGIFLSFGGQTALNCGLALERDGALARHGVRVLGTPTKAIRDTEDRRRFIDRLNEIDVKVANSRACQNADEARAAIEEIGLPVMLRGGFALGGKGSGVIRTAGEIDGALKRAFDAGTPQVLVEECLTGWKEIEYEVVRDYRGNCLTVCNMENMDPMGIHTGESIVVAPSQTLNDTEYQLLRSLAIRTIQHLGIIGECNIQYALDPNGVDYRVIEVNARLSRSSALASKATGYPLAYVAAKLGLGYALPDIPNGITRRTTAFFEPALDYLVCKIPRWDLTKFHGAAKTLGSEMKSVGEVMAIGRTFPEVVQKALRMLDIGVTGLESRAFEFEDLEEEIANGTPRRIFALAQALREGHDVADLHARCGIDPWFLRQIERIVQAERRLEATSAPISEAVLRESKQLGFSDQFLDLLTSSPAGTTRSRREELDIRPHLVQIDTMAAEFAAETNYLYSTYHARQPDVSPSDRKKILVLGSGVYRIGSSVEFDWCCVSAAQTARDLGFETLMLNYNPETVSTDFDMCDRLIFDEVSLESVLDVCAVEKPDGVVVSMGGQIANNLAHRLHDAGVPILGTSAVDIDRAEDRRKFSALLDDLAIDQPRWAHVTDTSAAEEVVDEVGGFPVLVRPSYVLSGAAMSVAHEPNELRKILGRAKRVSPDFPVVVSKFEIRAREVEIDAVADRGELVLWAVSEHVEDAGVHSGDATLVLPPQKLYLPTIRRAREIAAILARNLSITGPFNVQFLAKQNTVKVIECNLRASRSFPFVSKVTGQNFAAEAMRRMLDVREPVVNNSLDLDYVGVKVPMFSFSRLVGVDPMLGVEMASTGEVACLGEDLNEALLHGLAATGFVFPRKGVLLSLGPTANKYWFTDEAKALSRDLNLPVFATEGTARMLREVGVDCEVVGKGEEGEHSAVRLIDEGRIDLVINVPREYDSAGRPDGFLIRRRAVDAGIALITDLQLARAVVEAMRHRQPEGLKVSEWGSLIDH